MRLAYKCIIYFLVFAAACSNKREQTQAIRSDITVSLYASARIKSKDQYAIISPVPGIIKKVHVEPGSAVKEGDLLFTLENREASLNVDNARQVLDFSRTNNRISSDRLQESLSQVWISKEKLAMDSAFYYRQKSLWEQNIGTRQEYDQRHLAFTTSRINYEAALKRFGQLKNQLENDVELSSINYKVAKNRQGDYLIRSEIEGKIFDILKKKGELVGPQTVLGIAGKPSHFYLEMNVDENDITSVRLDQQVLINMDSFKEHLFKGRVSKIYPIMDEQSRTFRVEAIFLNPPVTLYPNLTAEANIIVQMKKNAILIPRSYLDKLDQVWLATGEKRKVSPGVHDEKNIEILKGLNTGEFILKPE